MSRIDPRLAAPALAVLFISGCQKPAPPVEGWRELSRSDVQALKKLRAAENPEQPPPIVQVTGDFNGDGHEDRVAFLVDEAGERFSPYLFDGAGAAPEELTRGGKTSELHRYSLSVMPPGAVVSICLEEPGADFESCERDKDFKHRVIVFYQVDQGGSLFAWNGRGFVERSLGSRLQSVSHARPADEHELAKQKPWYVSHSQMKPNPELGAFQPVKED